jgi:hypothetical protein
LEQRLTSQPENLGSLGGTGGCKQSVRGVIF